LAKSGDNKGNENEGDVGWGAIVGPSRTTCGSGEGQQAVFVIGKKRNKVEKTK